MRFNRLFILSTLFLLTSFTFQSDFLSEQKRFARVRTAFAEKQVGVETWLKNYDLTLEDFEMMIVAYKDLDKLEIHAKKKAELTFRKVATYDICARSGKLGPKRQQGDYQVPEGLYHIDRFNPSSGYYLSLGINYPNASDKRKSSAAKLGGDIFIHGECVTIGCLPMTNEGIKEIYLQAIYARNNGQMQIPVYIFPFEMTAENMKVYEGKYTNDQKLISFWRNLKPAYDFLQKNKKTISFSVAENGDYSIKN